MESTEESDLSQSDNDYLSGVESESENEDVELTYDSSVTASHTYLGENLEEVRGATLYDDGTILENFPLMIQDFVILHPGQLFPLVILYRPTIEMLKKCKKDKHCVFGVVPVFEGEEPRRSKFGTTAEIMEFSDSRNELCLKARGRQRFEILDVTENDGKAFGTVLILPEVRPRRPFEGAKITALDRLRTMGMDEERNRKKRIKLERFDASTTPWPAWVHNHADPWKLTARIKKHLSIWENKTRIPDTPNELSYWLGQNFPLKDIVRDKLLSMHSATPRLFFYAKFLSKKRIIVCEKCEAFYSTFTNMFPMTPEGLQSIFANPAGVMFEAVTLLKASGNLICSTVQPCAQYSWFPGYEWTTASCKNCNAHRGWRFTATKRGLKPSSFWALAGKGLRLAKYRRSQHTDSDYESDDSSSSVAIEIGK